MISLHTRTSVDLDTCCQLHWNGIKDRLTKRLRKLKERGFQETIRTFLQTRLELTIKSKPKDLVDLDSELKALIAAATVTDKTKKEVVDKISEIFSYTWLNDQPTKSSTYWLFSLANNLKVDVCPYCNANFTITIKDVQGKKVAKPAFDHFFPKSTHPLLAISFYNLIPSCNVCNSDLKGTDNFTLDGNFHPYLDDIESELEFRTSIKSFSGTFGFNDDFDLEIVVDDKSSQLAKLNNHLRAFHLTDVYRFRKGFAADVLKRNYMLTPSYTESLRSAFPSLNLSKADLYRFAYGSFWEDENLGSRPMSKMTRDLVKQHDDYFR